MNSASYIEPYILNWNGTVEHLKTCAIGACKKVVQIVVIVQS